MKDGSATADQPQMQATGMGQRLQRRQRKP